MAYEANGKVVQVFETRHVSEKFSKREFVIEIADNPRYPQVVSFQLTGDRCARLDSVGIGDIVRVEFSLRGREWKSPSGDVKFFNTLDCWKLDVKEKGAPRPEPVVVTGDNSDDLPF